MKEYQASLINNRFDIMEDTVRRLKQKQHFFPSIAQLVAKYSEVKEEYTVREQQVLRRENNCNKCENEGFMEFWEKKEEKQWYQFVCLCSCNAGKLRAQDNKNIESEYDVLIRQNKGANILFSNDPTHPEWEPGEITVKPTFDSNLDDMHIKGGLKRYG